MHILLLNYEFPPVGGGAGQASFHLMSSFLKLGHRVTVVTSGYSDLPAQQKVNGYFFIFRVNVGRKVIFQAKSFELIRYALQALRIIRNLHVRPDVVVSFFTLPAGPAGFFAARRFQCPHIICLRGMDVPGFDSFSLRWFHRFLRPVIKFLWQRADLLTAPSEYLMKLAKKNHSGPAPIVVIPNGIFPRPPHLHEHPPQKRLLAVGRMVAQKNQLFLLHHLATLRDLDWHLTLVGDGPLYLELRREILRLKLEDRISMPGWLNAEKLRRLYRNSDLLIHPSTDEGSSNVILESLSYGTPVLASSAGGTPEVIRHGVNGYLYGDEPAREFCDNLRRFFALPEASIQRLRAQAQTSVQAFTWQTIALQFEGEIEKRLIPRWGPRVSSRVLADTVYTREAIP